MERRSFLAALLSLLAVPRALFARKRSASFGAEFVGLDGTTINVTHYNSSLNKPWQQIPVVFGVLAPEMMPAPPYYRAHDRLDKNGKQWMNWDDWTSAYTFELIER
jgi:hypothetical protein